MKDKIKKILISLAIKAYDRLTIRAYNLEYAKDPNLLPVRAKAFYRVDKLGNETPFKYETNLADLAENPPAEITPDTIIRVRYMNSMYWLIADGCGQSVERLRENGFGMDELAPAQEILCGIFRHNHHQPRTRFLKYLQSCDGRFVCNDCYDCKLSTKYNECRLYASELNHGIPRS
ncbi:MAG: hypothetical protein FWG18_00650 [Alphaproteobacteria bacterium]|nr:hypothetical protein [Alphaproteobacteria bacterium]